MLRFIGDYQLTDEEMKKHAKTTPVRNLFSSYFLVILLFFT